MPVSPRRLHLPLGSLGHLVQATKVRGRSHSLLQPTVPAGLSLSTRPWPSGNELDLANPETRNVNVDGRGAARRHWSEADLPATGKLHQRAGEVRPFDDFTALGKLSKQCLRFSLASLEYSDPRARSRLPDQLPPRVAGSQLPSPPLLPPLRPLQAF